jgi:hypothetical protein
MVLILLPVSLLILYGISRHRLVRNHPGKILIMIGAGLILFLIGQLISMVIYHGK